MARPLFLFSIFCFALLSEATYDYFQMVQQWPPSTCSGRGTGCRTTPPRMFTIHGLWPSNYSTVRSTCSGSPFSPTQIASLRTQLNTYWPDVINGNNQRFWGHEWDAHGTCSENRFNQFQYFQLTLNIRTNQSYDLLAILNGAGLGPSGQTRSYQAIENAIQAATGQKPGLRCNTNARSGLRQLHEIILCFAQDGVTLVNCTQYAGITCPNQFVWHPRPPSSFAAAFSELKELLNYESPMGKLVVLSTILCIAFIFGKRLCGTTRGGRKRE